MAKFKKDLTLKCLVQSIILYFIICYLLATVKMIEQDESLRDYSGIILRKTTLSCKEKTVTFILV